MKSEQTANRHLANVPRGTPARKPLIPDYFQSMSSRADTRIISKVLRRGTTEILATLCKARREVGCDPYNFNPRAPFADMAVRS